MVEISDQLAIAVGSQWNAEAAARRLNEPYPLPVSWTAADSALTDTWDLMVTLARTGAGWLPPSREDAWAAGPDDLAGAGSDLASVLTRIPTGRMVVLGEPGAGKTMLMVRLVLDLLARRSSGDRVPFLASAASWNPADQDLRDWLATQLMMVHPVLAGPAAGVGEPSQARALLAHGLILPILDGLDEIPEPARGRAVSRINDALRPGEPIVVTCRTRQFREAVRPEAGLEVTLRAAAAVQLQPLDAGVVRDYLRQDAASPEARARWEPITELLGTGAPVGQALSTPLMVGLARVIYNPRPGELAGSLRDPGELRDPSLADRSAVETLLFDAFIPAAYRDDPARQKNAEKWLIFLSRHLESRIGSPDLAWWQLPRAASGLITAAAGITGLICGAFVGSMTAGDFVSGFAAAAIVGVLTIAVIAILGMVGCLVYARTRKAAVRPVRGVGWQLPSRSLILVSLALALVSMIFGAAGILIPIEFGSSTGART